MKQLLGVVMCGGESRRMGTDKGLIKIGGITWAQLAFNKLASLQFAPLVSINQTQKQSYQHLFKTADTVVDDTNLQGPLNGIFSVHHHHPEDDLLILACDMIDMEPSTLQQLVNTYRSTPGFDFYAYHNGDFFEPMCAIYTSAALSNIKNDVAKGLPANLSLQRVLDNGNTKRLPIINGDSFKNVNSK